ncbi:MAG: ABC transporter permease [Paracoccaceae bacterium]
MSRLPAWVDVGLIPVLNLTLALAVAGVVIALVGEDPLAALSVMIDGAFVYPGSLGYTLHYATNFVFTGLAVAVAFQARLFNIGAEGQAAIAGVAAAAVALALGPWLWGIVAIPLAIVAAAAGGALWAAVPGWLQAYRGSHIVITTIMFNFIAAGVVVALVSGPMKREGQAAPKTAEIADSARLPFVHDLAAGIGLEAGRSPLNLAFVLALLVAFGVWVLVWRTRWGFALRAMGQSEPAAVYAGIPVRRLTVQAMAVSGALAGLMAVNEVVGAQGEVVIDFTAGYGFTGIAVALMGRAHPVGVVLAALLFGALFQGGAELDFEFQTITREMVLLVQGLIILFSGALALLFVPALTRLLGR